MFNILAHVAFEIEGIFQHLLLAPPELLYIYFSLLYATYMHMHSPFSLKPMCYHFQLLSGHVHQCCAQSLCSLFNDSKSTPKQLTTNIRARQFYHWAGCLLCLCYLLRDTKIFTLISSHILMKGYNNMLNSTYVLFQITSSLVLPNATSVFLQFLFSPSKLSPVAETRQSCLIQFKSLMVFLNLSNGAF